MIDDDRSAIFFHPQMISRRRSRLGRHAAAAAATRQSVGSDLSCLGRDDLLPQAGRVIIDGHRSGHDWRIGRFGRRITRRRLGAPDK